MDNKDITILGIGGAGCRIISKLNKSELSSDILLLATDTNSKALDDTELDEQYLLQSGSRLLNGRGCGGEPTNGQRAYSFERGKLEKLLTGTKLLILCGGLGGGCCSGGVPIVVSVARKLSIPIVGIFTLPFSFEGQNRRKNADNAINEIFSITDAIISIPNDYLFSILPPETLLDESFNLSVEQLAISTLALSSVLIQGELLSTTLDDFISLLKRKKSYCSIGVGFSSGEVGQRGDLALEKLWSSPMLGGNEQIKNADAIVVSLISDKRLTIGETDEILKKVTAKSSPGAKVIIGATTTSSWNDRLQLCLLAVKFDENTLLTSNTSKITKARRVNAVKTGILKQDNEVEQMLLEFDSYNKGSMENTTSVIFNGEDLDIPTFKRRHIHIETE